MKEPSRFLPFLPDFSSFFPIFPDFCSLFRFLANFSLSGVELCLHCTPSGYATDCRISIWTTDLVASGFLLLMSAGYRSKLPC